MNVDDIITLDNNSEYVLLEKVELEGKVYYFAAGITKEEEATGEYVFIEEVKKDEKTFVKMVEDNTIYAKLSTILTKEYSDAVASLEEQE